ncbi:MAG: hypothetical protein KDJ51_05880 [Nitratireductor sp.]|nr:hypothetical protein [Nitratireductor sp.]
MSSRMPFAIVALILGLAASPVLADEPGCGGAPVTEQEIFNASEKLLGTADASLERQILFVDTYRPVVGAYIPSSADTRPRDSVTFFLAGRPSPSSSVNAMTIQFRDDGTVLPRPSYNATTKTINVFVADRRYQAIKDLLDSCAPVYAQYREFNGGHVWADLHVGAVRAGNGRH